MGKTTYVSLTKKDPRRWNGMEENVVQGKEFVEGTSDMGNVFDLYVYLS